YARLTSFGGFCPLERERGKRGTIFLFRWIPAYAGMSECCSASAIGGLVHRRFVYDQPQMRRGCRHHVAVDAQIILRHTARGEALLEPAAYFFARKISEPIDRA